MGLWILEEVSRNLLSRCLRAKPAAYSATAGTPQAWLGLVGREGGWEGVREGGARARNRSRHLGCR